MSTEKITSKTSLSDKEVKQIFVEEPIENMKKSIETKLDEILERIGGLEEEFAGFKKEFGGFKKEFGGFKEEFGGFKEDNKSIIGRLDSLEKNNKSIIGRLDSLEKNKITKKTIKTIIDNSIKTIKYRLDGLEKKFDDLEEKTRNDSLSIEKMNSVLGNNSINTIEGQGTAFGAVGIPLQPIRTFDRIGRTPVRRVNSYYMMKDFD